MKVSKSKILFALLVALLAAGYFYSQYQSRSLLHLTGSTMGTQYSIMIADHPGKAISEKGLKRGVDDLLAIINEQMSTYISDSEISRFNQSESLLPFPVSAEHFAVAQLAREISRETKGAFEPTVSPLVDLWGFGPKAVPTRIPTAEHLTEAKKHVGIEYLRLDNTGDKYTFSKLKPWVQLDFSAIAKGYAVDLISSYLVKAGHRNHMVEIGGEIRVSGEKSPNQLWTIGIEKPEGESRTSLRKLTITNNSIATSGSYRNYFEEGGKRYSHTIDPRTGMPIDHNMISVTVIAASCGVADAYATAFMVMGPRATIEFANKKNLAVYALIKDQTTIKPRMSESFEKLYSGD